jgi:hypothetical protein
MSPSVHLVPERRDPPDLERFVSALLAFALARLEEEEAAKEAAEQPEDKDG